MKVSPRSSGVLEKRPMSPAVWNPAPGSCMEEERLPPGKLPAPKLPTSSEFRPPLNSAFRSTSRANVSPVLRARTLLTRKTGGAGGTHQLRPRPSLSGKEPSSFQKSDGSPPSPPPSALPSGLAPGMSILRSPSYDVPGCLFCGVGSAQATHLADRSVPPPAPISGPV